jgi:hypothetical protein
MEFIPDGRVKIFRYEQGNNIVGALKRYACEKCTGDILVELDHDDILLPTCLEEVNNVFQNNENVDFVYSDAASVHQDWTSEIWSEVYGWKYEEIEYDGHKILSAIAPEPDIQSISRIWFAPNHVRAWKRDFYFKIGGHDKTMQISDDQDLMLRTYIHGKMYHIPKCLYIYWIDGNNTWIKYSENIQVEQWKCYDKYIYEASEKWSKENNLINLNLSEFDVPSGYKVLTPGNAKNKFKEYQDNSVGIIRSIDTLKNFDNAIDIMNECWRVLTHGGFFFIEVPSTDGKGAWCDPTHKTYWNDRSFKYYTEVGLRSYIEPECYCRFLNIRVDNILKYDNVPYVRAHLIAIKNDIKKFHGHYQI